MKAVDKIRAKLSSCAAACRGFCRPDNMAGSVKSSRDGFGRSKGMDAQSE